MTNLSGRKHIVHIIGTRPQFPKCAPVYRALHRFNFSQTVIHTGQHYDDKLSKEIIEDTGCPIHVRLNCCNRENTKTVLRDLLSQLTADLVIVYGDCNTSYDAAQVAYDLRVKIAHVEAGLRCGDNFMIEEFNRIEIDKISNILYVPSVDAVWNLARAGVPFDMIQFVGNVMADTYYWHMQRPHTNMRGYFGLVTLHRAENMNKDFLRCFMDTLADLNYPIVFPKHPRVVLEWVPRNVKVVAPMRYDEFNAHLRACTFVLTDSGGVQEEATLSYIPCLTLRPNTERPVTITEGTNELVTLATVKEKVRLIREGKWKRGSIPLYWDGHAAERIACHLRRYLSL